MSLDWRQAPGGFAGSPSPSDGTRSWRHRPWEAADSRWAVALLALLLLVLQFAAMAPRLHRGSLPLIVADEVGYIENATRLAEISLDGPAPELAYPTGYSLFLVPAHLLCAHPFDSYRGSLITNGLLFLAGFAIAYRLAARRLGSRRRAMLLAVVVGAHPVMFMATSAAMSENAFVMMQFIALWGLAAACRKPGSWAAWATFGFTSGFCLQVRALGLANIFACIATALLLTRRARGARVPLLTGVGGGLLGAVLLKWCVNDLILDASIYRSESTGGILRHALGEPTKTARVLIGHAGYQVISTWGLAAVAIVQVIPGLRRLLGANRREVALGSGVEQEPLPWLPAATVYIVLAWGIGMGGGVLFMASKAFRSDHLYYGRYADGWVPALLLITGLLLVGQPCWARVTGRRLAAMSGVAAAVIVALLAAAPDPAGLPCMLFNVQALMPFVEFTGRDGLGEHLPRIILYGSLVAVALGGGMIIASRRWPVVAPAALLVLLGWTSYLARQRLYTPLDRNVRLAACLVRRHAATGAPLTPVAYDRKHYHIRTFFDWKFYAPRVSRFSGEEGFRALGSPPDHLLITDVGETWPAATHRLVLFDHHSGQSLWVHGGSELGRELLRTGRTIALDGWDSRALAYRVTIVVDDDRVILGRLENCGCTPLLPTAKMALPHGINPLRVGVVSLDADGAILDRSHRIDIDRPVFPGESLKLLVPYEYIRSGAAALRLDLVEEGRRWVPPTAYDHDAVLPLLRGGVPEDLTIPVEQFPGFAGTGSATWAFDLDAGNVGTVVGTKPGNGTIRIDGRAGWVLFGPYIRLTAGIFNVTVRFAENPALAIRDGLRFDAVGIASGVGGQQRHTLVDAAVADGWITERNGITSATFPITLVEALDQVEFRLHAPQPATLVVAGLRLRRTEPATAEKARP